MWPDTVDPRRVGLSDAEFLALAHREILDANDQELLRLAGVVVLDDDEADAEGIPPEARTLEHGVVIIKVKEWLQINRTHWAEIAEARDEEQARATELLKLGPLTPVPFWLAFCEPVYGPNFLSDPRQLATADGRDISEVLIDPPGVDDVRAWADVSDEMLIELARCVLVATLPANGHPYIYIRGSRLRDLVGRPLRSLEEWREHYPHMVIDELGGRPFDLSESAAEWDFEDGLHFWQVLQVPDWFSVPEGDLETMGPRIEAVSQLVERDWFEPQGFDHIVDSFALARFGTRRIEAWRKSDFARLLVASAL
jgi:hypothetical protein